MEPSFEKATAPWRRGPGSGRGATVMKGDRRGLSAVGAERLIPYRQLDVSMGSQRARATRAASSTGGVMINPTFMYCPQPMR